MKKITIFLSGAILLVVLFAATAFKPLPPGPSANGQAQINPPYLNGIPQTFSFHANTDANGNVSGSFESHSPGQEIRIHGNINCLQVLPDGKTAFLNGVITHRDGAGYPGGFNVGDHIFFWVKDNGEGANAPKDQFTDYLSSGPNSFCGAFPPPPFFTLWISPVAIYK